MIRRNVPLTDQADKWLLISQVEHARVSAELAAAWGGGRVANVVCPVDDANLLLQQVRRELLAAVLHHDDGWAGWEASPALDPEEGRPYSFTELSRREALELWRDSILRARQIGPLAGWVVAGHFEQLLDDSDDPHCEFSNHWLTEVRAWRDNWLTEWGSLNRPIHTHVLAEQCRDWLRLFDWISLWLCCYCPARPDDEICDATTCRDGLLAATPVSLRPSFQHEGSDPREVQVSAWPFATEAVELDVLGYSVPAQNYRTSGQLAKSRSPMRLRWRLAPT